MQSEHIVGFVLNSGGRGTLDILWSCLVTVVLCTWTIQHLQVVPRTYSRSALFLQKTFWMFITLLCPEYVAWIALEEWRRARKYRFVTSLGHGPWTMQEAFYIDMGGLQLLLEAPLHPSLIMTFGGAVEDVAYYTIRLDDLALLVSEGVLSSMPEIQSHDLEERSTMNHFAWIVTLLQVIRFVAVAFARIGGGLPISTLEVATLASIFCAAWIQYFWWNKPLDVRNVTTITLDPDKVDNFVSCLPRLQFSVPEQALAYAGKAEFTSFFHRIIENNERKRTMAYAVLIGCIFNSIHLSAWNLSFPSHFEHRLWQTASMGACVAFVMAWAATFIPRRSGFLLAAFFSVVYCVSRAYLMAEIFAGLRSAPSALYQSPRWMNALPGL